MYIQYSIYNKLYNHSFLFFKKQDITVGRNSIQIQFV